MRILAVFVIIALAKKVTAKCTTDNCLRAVQEAASSLREEDCKSFVQVTATPTTRTSSSSVVVTTTETTSEITTEIITSPAEPSKRWLQKHEVINVLLGRAVHDDGPKTARGASIPAYASHCSSAAAYESACSCLGVTPATTTAPTPSVTHAPRIIETTTVGVIHTVTAYVNGLSLFGNTTGGKFGNLTAPFLNATGSDLSSSSGISSSSSSLVALSDGKTSTGKHKLKRPSIVGVSSSAKTPASTATITTSGTPNSLTPLNNTGNPIKTANFTSVFNTTTSAGKFLNSSSALARPSTSSFSNGTTSRADITLNSTTTLAPFLNSTVAAAAINPTSNTTNLSNSTLPAPFVNTTHTPFPFLNTSTPAPFPFLNTTNTTNATTTTPVRFANTTSSNTSTSTSTPIPTPTSSPLCSSPLTPFRIRVSQPGGLFDGWYLRVSGSGVIFVPSADRGSEFSFSPDDGDGGTQQHLCSTTPGTEVAQGINGTTLVAIAEAPPDISGSAVYFVEPHVLADIENDEKGWYGVLECGSASGMASSVAFASATAYTLTPASSTNFTASSASISASGSALECSQGAKRYWVGCGLGLDITSDGDGTAVVGGWNCSAVALSVEYLASSA